MRSTSARRSSTGIQNEERQKVLTAELNRALVEKEQAYLADLQQFAQELKVLRTDKYRVDTATERLETRMINIISFSTTIEMFGRLLNDREIRAQLIMGEPVDDTSYLQERVDFLEATVRSLPDGHSQVNEDIKNANFDDQVAIELLESQNVARRLKLQLQRRVQSRSWAGKVAKVKFTARERRPVDVARQHDIAQKDLITAEEVAALSNQRQHELDAIQQELTRRENAVDAALRQHQAEQDPKERRIAALRQELHENASLCLQINGLREENSQLREQLFRLLDSGSDVRRERAQLDNAQKNHEFFADDARRGQARLNDRRRAMAKRDQQIEERRAKMWEKQEPIQQAEVDVEAKLNEVLELEEQGHKVEQALNKVLKETQLIVGFPVRVVKQAHRTQEMEKMFSLVTKHEDVLN
jgi:chromosome segregation ATPase